MITFWIPGKAAERLLPSEGIEVIDEDRRGERTRFLLETDIETALGLKGRAEDLAQKFSSSSWDAGSLWRTSQVVEEALGARQEILSEPVNLTNILEQLKRFRDERDWQQFHTPRNLAAAIAIEAGELQEILLWKTDDEVQELLRTPKGVQAVSHEVADVLIFSLLLCMETGIDPLRAIEEKFAINEQKYPVELAKGKANKYDRLTDPA